MHNPLHRHREISVSRRGTNQGRNLAQSHGFEARLPPGPINKRSIGASTVAPFSISCSMMTSSTGLCAIARIWN